MEKKNFWSVCCLPLSGSLLDVIISQVHGQAHGLDTWRCRQTEVLQGLCYRCQQHHVTCQVCDNQHLCPWGRQWVDLHTHCTGREVRTPLAVLKEGEKELPTSQLNFDWCSRTLLNWWDDLRHVLWAIYWKAYSSSLCQKFYWHPERRGRQMSPRLLL